MAIYVSPWYNSDPLTIDVGAYNDELSSDDPQKMLETAEKIRTEIDQLPIQTLYVLSIRLYDLGQKEQALYWFYTARFRTRIFTEMLCEEGRVGDAAFETRQALAAFSKLAGTTFDRYAGSQVELFAGVLTRVTDEGRKTGPVAGAYPDYKFSDPSQQQAIADQEASELEQFRTYILENQEEIEATVGRLSPDKK